MTETATVLSLLGTIGIFFYVSFSFFLLHSKTKEKNIPSTIDMYKYFGIMFFCFSLIFTIILSGYTLVINEGLQEAGILSASFYIIMILFGICGGIGIFASGVLLIIDLFLKLLGKRPETGVKQ